MIRGMTTQAPTPPTLSELVEASRFVDERGAPDIGALAAAAGMHTSSLYRWIADNRVPKETSRAALARALGVTPAEIPNGANHRYGGTFAVHASIVEIPNETWERLVDGLQPGDRIDLCLGTGLLLHELGGAFLDTLRYMARRGVTVRVMLGNPDAAHAFARGEEEGMGGAAFVDRQRYGVERWRDTLAGLPDAELRLYDGPYAAGTYRIGSDLIIAPYLHGAVGTDSPAIQCDTHTSVLTDAYAADFESRWAAATPVDQH